MKFTCTVRLEFMPNEQRLLLSVLQLMLPKKEPDELVAVNVTLRALSIVTWQSEEQETSFGTPLTATRTVPEPSPTKSNLSVKAAGAATVTVPADVKQLGAEPATGTQARNAYTPGVVASGIPTVRVPEEICPGDKGPVVIRVPDKVVTEAPATKDHVVTRGPGIGVAAEGFQIVSVARKLVPANTVLVGGLDTVAITCAEDGSGNRSKMSCPAIAHAHAFWLRLRSDVNMPAPKSKFVLEPKFLRGIRNAT